MLAALAALALILSGCKPAVNPEAAASPAPSGASSAVVPASEGQQASDATEAALPTSAEAAEADVVFSGGRLSGSSFSWEFFRAKVAAARPAELSVAVEEPGSARLLRVSFHDGAFTAECGGESRDYSSLVQLESEESSFFVLTNEPELSAADFFAGKEPSASLVGEFTDLGVAVFAQLG